MVKDRHLTNLHIKPNVSDRYMYDWDSEKLGKYLKDLNKSKKIIEQHDYNFENWGLCSKERVEKVISEIKEQIKLCEHHFKTKKRKDLFKWIFKEKVKPNNWGSERDLYEYSNGMIKAVIEVYKNPLSTKIESYLKVDCELDLYTNLGSNNRIIKTLRSEKSIKEYICGMKESLLKEVEKVKYEKREKEFMDFILGGSK